MVPTSNARFEEDPSWIKYFRFYAKDLREIKSSIQFSQKIHFECQECGRCCDFNACQHRCLLSWADVTRWHAAGFDLGFFFVFPAHSIDGFSALGIPTKGELKSGKFYQWIRSLDENDIVLSNLPRLTQLLSTNLGDTSLLQVENSGNGDCIYLGPDQRCLIHPIRPGACRLFPYLQTKIIQISRNNDPNLEEEPSVLCPRDAFISGEDFPEDVQQITRECGEAEAAAWAQERVSQPEVENLLLEIWREIVPKF